MNKVKFWTNAHIFNPASDPLGAVQATQRLERDGWDGAAFVDSQNMRPEVWAIMALCALGTKTIMLATRRHQPLEPPSGGYSFGGGHDPGDLRGAVVLGLGRGDSALAYVGAPPMKMDRFEPAMEVIQTYLRGEAVPLEVAASFIQGAEEGFDKVAVNELPEGSRLTWLSADAPKVPLEAMVTGPKAIEAAARVADAVTLAVGADPIRVAWAIETARAAAGAAGRDASALTMGAYIAVVPHPDVAVARDLARGNLASSARFSVINKQVVGPTDEKQRRTLEKIASVYDMRQHGKGGPQGAALDDDFVDGFAIVGDPDHCVARLRKLIDLGISRFTFTLPQGQSAEVEKSYALLCRDVLPRARA